MIDINHLAKLTNVVVTPDEAAKLTTQFEATFKTIDTLKELDTSHLKTTPQVTGLTNVLRDDVINTHRMFTQEAALTLAPKSAKGYFVVKSVFI